MKPLSTALLLALALNGCGKISGNSNPDASIASGALALAAPSSWVPQAGSTPIGFTITRDATTSGALTVHVDGLPAGVTADDVAVAAGVSTGTVTFAATAASTVGSSTNVTVQLLADTTMLDHQPFTVKVAGSPGSLDTTFGTVGRAVFPLPDPVVVATSGNGYARALVVYPATAGADAGKILIATELETTGSASTSRELAVVRFNADGTPDATFGGGDAYALIDGSPSHAFYPAGIALDSQQRIVVLAEYQTTGDNCDVFVTRLTSTGGPDSAFTTFNALPDAIGYCGAVKDVAMLPGDKIEILTYWNNPDQTQRPLLVQLNSNGSPDTTAFPGSAYAIRMPNPDSTKPTWLPGRILVDGQGRLLVEGTKCEGGWAASYSACESVVGRITAAGAWDTTFGTAGTGHLGYSALTFGTTNSSSIQGFQSKVLDANQNVVEVGWNEGYTTGTMARFDGTGAVDNSFATSGRATPTLVVGGTDQELDDVAIDDQGRILAIGYAVDGGSLIAVTRYSAAGALDATYGTSGVTTEPAGGLSPRGALQPDGRLIVIGVYPRGSGVDLAIWRFWP